MTRTEEIRRRLLQDRGLLTTAPPRPRPLRQPPATPLDGRKTMAMRYVESRTGRTIEWWLDQGSSRAVEAALAKRGVMVDHTTLFKWKDRLGLNHTTETSRPTSSS